MFIIIPKTFPPIPSFTDWHPAADAYIRYTTARNINLNAAYPASQAAIPVMNDAHFALKKQAAKLIWDLEVI